MPNPYRGLSRIGVRSPRLPEGLPVSKRSPHLPWGGLLAVVLLLTACSTNPLTAPPPTIPPAQPAVSPPITKHPAGSVHDLAGQPTAAVFDSVTGLLALLCPTADQRDSTIALVDAARHSSVVLALPAPAAALTGNRHGVAYLAGHGGYSTVELATRRISQIAVDGAGDVDFTAIAVRDDGVVVLGSADGAVYTLASDGVRVAERAKIFARVDAVVAQGNIAVVLDRGQTSVTTVGPNGKPQYSLRAGQGATTLTANAGGPVLAVDTRGGQLLVYTVDPLMLRQAYPVPDAPYGVAGAGVFAWVSQTKTNTVIGYDLSTGIPVEKVRYPTVQQPDILVFDDSSDTLYVMSARTATYQVIDHASTPR